ncbi:MAG: FemAB family XrtA/PEP-CTERM system-associated protein [Phycisphaerae bacterium]
MMISFLPAPDERCDRFLQGNPQATLCHTYEWNDMIRRTFGHECYYLMATESGTVRGVLPLVRIRSRLFGNQMVSGAFGNYGGPVADSREALDGLFERSVQLAEEVGCETIEFRNVQPMPQDLLLRTDKVCLRLPLVNDAQSLWNSFRSETKVRNHIRKAEKAGIVTEMGGLELIEEFYELYTIRMHQLGTPCYTRKLMENIIVSFPETSRLFVARLDGRAIAARLAVCYNGVVESCWGVTRTEYNNLSPNHALYWAAIKHYCEAGAKYFDFGRSTVDTGPYLFKRQWGAQPVQLHYQYWSRPGHEVTILSPEHPKFRRRVEVWKRMPLCLTRWIGPRISRSLA